MTRKEFNAEVNYQMTMHYAQELLKEGVVTADEIDEFERMIHAKYHPVFGDIFLSLA